MFEDSRCAQRLSLLLALLVALFSGCIQAQAGTREAMAEAMAKMMEALGLLDSAIRRPAFPTHGWPIASMASGRGETASC